MWSAARPLRIARSPCLSALAHTSMHAPEASSAAHPLHRLPVGQGSVRLVGAPGAAPSAPRRGCSRCLGAAHSRLSGRAALSPLVRQPRALIARPPLSGGGGGERSRVCAAGPLSRATARLPPPPPPRVRAALGSLLQPHRRGRRVRRSRQGACPKGESLLTRRARFAAAPPPSHAAAAAVSPHATCRRESPAADYSAETWRSAVRPAAVAAARSSCPGARRVDPATPPAVGGARPARPCRRVLPIAPRPSPRRLPPPRRQLGERRWRSLRRTPWLHARPVGVPEAMCG